jgi:hypothetical protein
MNADERWREVERMLRAPDPADLESMRALIRVEIANNRADDDIGCGDTLYGLCTLLSLLGSAEDVALVHEAKFLNMDTGAMIELDLLTMHRDRDTMMQVISALPGAAANLARDVAAAFKDPRSPKEIEAAMRGYFELDR